MGNFAGALRFEREPMNIIRAIESVLDDDDDARTTAIVAFARDQDAERRRRARVEEVAVLSFCVLGFGVAALLSQLSLF